MIANALYNGQSVLFVAEKMAALNVVQERLLDWGWQIMYWSCILIRQENRLFCKN